MPVTVSNLAFRRTTTYCDLQVVCFGAFKRFVSATILESIIRTYNMAIHSVLDSAIEKKKCVFKSKASFPLLVLIIVFGPSPFIPFFIRLNFHEKYLRKTSTAIENCAMKEQTSACFILSLTVLMFALCKDNTHDAV
jgi:hypothetical protein